MESFQARDRIEIAVWFAACAAALLWAVAAVDRLPMADLPQHAAQVAGWMRLGAGDAAYAGARELNWWTPNLLGYAIARAAAIVLPVPRALGLVVALGLIATPLVIARELARRGDDPRWALALFPLGFTMAFYWGLFNFLVGVALVPWYLCRVERADSPRRSAVQILVAGLLLIAAHALLFAFASVAAALSLLADGRARLRSLWPVLAPWPALAVWLAITREHEVLATEGLRWHLEAVRLIQLPREIAGLAAGVEPVQAVCAILLLASPFALGAKPSRKVSRWIPVLLAVALFLLAPFRAFGNACLYPRFAALVVPLAWLALSSSERALAPRLRALVPVLALCAIGSIGLRLRAFELESADLAAVLRAAEPGRRMLGLCYDPFSPIVAAPVYDHMAMWYEVAGGDVEPSFAGRYPMLVRYRDRVAHLPAEYNPRDFQVTDGPFDYYLVRAPIDLGPRLFHGLAVEPVTHQGRYWLYRR